LLEGEDLLLLIDKKLGVIQNSTRIMNCLMRKEEKEEKEGKEGKEERN
jgi:hypothetical protein